MFLSLRNLFLLIFLVSCATPRTQNKSSQANVKTNYNRSEWTHWTESNRNCLNTRAEVLKAHSLVPVTMNTKGCKVVKGKWRDYYYDETHTAAGQVDIDHIVPLHHAHYAGGASWGRVLKEKFANDPENLVITNRKYNSQKGPKGIDEWLPVEKKYACKYVRDWQKVKRKYGLRLSASEQLTISELNCKK